MKDQEYLLNSMLFLSDAKEFVVVQEDFISNMENMKLLINLLTNIFQNSGVVVL